MKRFLKILIVFVFACISLITFSACKEKVIFPSSSISLGLALENNGQVTQEVTFSFQKDNLTKLNVKDKLIEEVKSNLISAVNVLRNEFYISFLVIYSLSPNPEFKIGESVLVSDVVYNEEYDVVGFDIVYKDLATWQYFQGRGGEQEADPVKKDKSIKYFETTSSEGKFPFASEFTNQDGSKTTIGERYQKIYRTAYNITLPNQIVDALETPKFVYDYATPFSSLRSNAEIQTYSGGLYHNVWIKDQENFKDSKIKLEATTIYAGWWYLSLFIGVILALAVACIITKICKIKRG